MKYVYKDQPYTLTLDTNNTLSGATELKILYRKPDGTTGEWDGTDTDTSIQVDVAGADNDLAGVWSMQTSCIFSGNSGATLGDLFLLRVKEPWEK